MPTYKVLDIIKGTTVDGPGLRTSIYLSGCSHHCPECHNPQSWDPDNGNSMTLDEILRIIEDEDFNVTLTGGDPLFNPEAIKPLLEKIKENRRNVWLYTGYLWDDIISSNILLETARLADVIVDGPFIPQLRDEQLKFRGSANQRLIKVKESILSGEVILYDC